MKMLSACLLLLPFISCTQVQDTKNDAVIEQKIEALLSRMTLEEKIGQMNQISSYGNIEDTIAARIQVSCDSGTV